VKTFIKRARLSFPTLWVPEPYETGGRNRYSAALLVPKNDPQIATIKEAIMDAGVAAYGDKFKDPKFRKTVKMHGFRDGDEKEYTGYADHYFIASHRPESKGPPLVLDTNKRELTANSGRPYGGCYVNASVEFWGDSRSGMTKAINCTLLGLQFVADGASFGGGSPASADDFEEIEPEVDEAFTGETATVEEGDDDFDPLA